MVKISLFFLVFVLIAAWIFSGWPQIWQNPSFPPGIEKIQAEAERQSPDAILVLTNLSPNDVTYIQDDPDNPDGNWLVASGNNASTDVRVSFPLPSGNLTVGPDLQEFKAYVRKFSQTQTGTPTARIELWEDGVLIRAGSNVNVTGTGQVISFTWNASEISNGDGSLVEANVVGTKTGGPAGTRNTVDVGAVEWNVDYTSLATTFLIGGTETGTKDTAVTTITFPEGSPAATITAPYNDVDGSGDPQVLHATVSEPVVKIKNTHASQTYNVVLEITTWTNSVVDMEYYNLAIDGATNIETVAAELSNANGAARTVSTGVSIAAGTYKDLYLKLVLGSVAGKTGTSTLTILGEVP